MGNLCPGDAETKRINRNLRQEQNQDENVIKLLFLGAGGSGKSTLFRQLRLLHGNGLKDKERMNYKPNIYQNIVVGMKALLEANSELLGDGDEEIDHKEEEQPTNYVRCDAKLAEYIDELDEAAPISAASADYLKKAWQDKGMQQTWIERSKFQLEDSLKYYMENIDRIAQEGYIPSKDDVMHVRICTTGIIQENLTMEGRPFVIVDVGGQRSERRKWIQCFDDVTGLIFVASLTAYNQFLFEDESVNRLDESLQLFRNIFANDTFDDACLVLFLNKSDLFTEMIKEFPMGKCFSDYQGTDSESDQFNYIRSLYEKQAVRKVKDKSGKIKDKKVSEKIFIHKTCATNTNQIKIIFDAVNQTVIHQMLVKAGLLPPE